MTGLPLILSATVRATLLRRADEAAPNECCGALLGRANEVTRCVELINRASSPRDAFEASARDILAAEARAEREGLEVLGIYHSHVEAPAAPSERDTHAAVPGWCFVIISVASREVRAYRLSGAVLAEVRVASPA